MRVLLVEDDAETRSVLVDVLRDEGVDACSCSTGEEALELLRSRGFDALIADHVMPGMSGLDLVHLARGMDEHLRCVVLSGTAPPSGADVPWLRKPISIGALLGAIEATGSDAPT